MTSGDGTVPSPDGDLLLEAVADYVRLLEAADSNLDLDEFVARYPAAMRTELAALCRAHRKVAHNLPAPGLHGSDSRASGQGTDAAATARRIGDFEIIEELGRGGMGVVYLAEELGLRRRVALKLLSPTFAHSQNHKARFRREAAAAARLQHPGIVPIHSFGEVDGTLYYAMEFVPGRDLAEHIAGARTAERGERPYLGVLPKAPYAAELAELVARIAEALHHAHEQGIVHRDVKPSNIVLGADGNPRVLDFGLAKHTEDADLAVSRTGELNGTPQYMSPEQTLAQRVAVDRRSDVFALGAILYELCTTQRAFAGATLQELVFQISFVDPPPLDRVDPSLPHDLGVVCAKAMEKDPRRRYATAAEFAADLRRFVGFHPIRARPASAWIRARRWLRRHRATAAAVAAIVILTLTWVTWRVIESNREAERIAELTAQAESALARQEFDVVDRHLRDLAGLHSEPEELERLVARLHAAREDARRDGELQRLAAERLITQSALHLTTDPELALALALAGVERGAGPVDGHLDDAATATSLITALQACVRSTTLAASDATVPTTARFVPGSNSVVTSGATGTTLWRAVDGGGQRATVVPATASPTGPIAIAGDGTLLAIADRRQRVTLWRLPDLEAAGEVPVQDGAIRELALSSDGRLLGMILTDRSCQLWLIGANPPERRFDGRPRSGAMTLAFAPDRPRLLVTHHDHGLWVIDDDGDRPLTLPGVRGLAPQRHTTACWLPGGEEIARLTDGRLVEVRPVAGDGSRRTFRCASPVTALTVSHDGTVLGVGCEDRTARLWSIDGGEELLIVSGHGAAISNLAITGRSGIVVTAADDRTVGVHELASGRRLAWLPQPGQVGELEVSADGAHVLCRLLDQSPRLWHLTAERSSLHFVAHRTPVRTIAFSGDGSTVFTTGEHGLLRSWRTADGRLRGERQCQGLAQSSRWTYYANADDVLHLVASEHLFGFDQDELAERWHVWLRPKGDAPGFLRRQRGIHHAAIAPGGQLYVVTRGTASRVDPAVAKTGPWITGVVDAAGGLVVAVQPLARSRLVVLRADGALELRRDAGDHSEFVADVRSAGSGLRQLARAGDGEHWVATGPGFAHVFDITGEPLAEFEAAGEPITAVAMSDDGAHVALGHRDGSATVFAAATGQRLLGWQPHRDRIDAIAFSPDGRRCGTAAADRRVRIWPTDPVAAARAYGGRGLRMVERERFRLLADHDQLIKERVDALYEQHVLTRDVLAALATAAASATATWPAGTLERAREYALERPNRSAESLVRGAQVVIHDLDSREAPLRRALGEVRAAIRLRPQASEFRILEALALHRIADHLGALDALEVARSMGPRAETQPLPWAIRTLACRALDRSAEAAAAQRRLRELLPGAGGPRAPRRPGRPMAGPAGERQPRATHGQQAWIGRALAER